MYINEDGEYVVVHNKGSYIEYKTYQDNGWVRVNCEYSDGTLTETFEKE